VTEITLPNGRKATVRVTLKPDTMDGGEWDVDIHGGPSLHVWAGGRAGKDLTRLLEAIRECAYDALVRVPEDHPGDRIEVELRADHFDRLL
jgi:hypothetical protein